MNYSLEYAIDLEKSCKKFPKKDKESIVKALEELRDNPRLYGAIKLSGRDDSYRYRVGNYRILYKIFDQKLIVLIIDIDGRADIYKKK